MPRIKAEKTKYFLTTDCAWPDKSFDANTELKEIVIIENQLLIASNYIYHGKEYIL
jgi:hypothetical protein